MSSRPYLIVDAAAKACSERFPLWLRERNGIVVYEDQNADSPVRGQRVMLPARMRTPEGPADAPAVWESTSGLSAVKIDHVRMEDFGDDIKACLAACFAFEKPGVKWRNLGLRAVPQSRDALVIPEPRASDSGLRSGARYPLLEFAGDEVSGGSSYHSPERRRQAVQATIRSWLPLAAEAVSRKLGLPADDFVEVLRVLFHEAGGALADEDVEKARNRYLSRQSLAFTGDSGCGSGDRECDAGPRDPDAVHGLARVAAYKADRQEDNR